MALAKLYEDAGRYDDAEAQLAQGQRGQAERPGRPASLAGYYNRQGDFAKTIEALEQAAALEPNNPEGYHRVAVFYWDKTPRRLPPLEARRSATTSRRGWPEDKALSLNPDYMEAMTYKNILLRLRPTSPKDRPSRSASSRGRQAPQQGHRR